MNLGVRGGKSQKDKCNEICLEDLEIRKPKRPIKLYFDLIYNQGREITSELQQDRQSHSLLGKSNQGQSSGKIEG